MDEENQKDKNKKEKVLDEQYTRPVLHTEKPQPKKKKEK